MDQLHIIFLYKYSFAIKFIAFYYCRPLAHQLHTMMKRCMLLQLCVHSAITASNVGRHVYHGRWQSRHHHVVPEFDASTGRWDQFGLTEQVDKEDIVAPPVVPELDVSTGRWDQFGLTEQDKKEIMAKYLPESIQQYAEYRPDDTIPSLLNMENNPVKFEESGLLTNKQEMEMLSDKLHDD